MDKTEYPLISVGEDLEFEKKAKCEHPERLKGKLGDCSQEQIRQCHGEDREHPCLEKK
jgi:hypothetical protein